MAKLFHNRCTNDKKARRPTVESLTAGTNLAYTTSEVDDRSLSRRDNALAVWRD